jgi:hypothetical protein
MMIPSSSREVRRVAASDQDVDDELAGHFGEVAVCVIVAAT